MAKIVTPLTNTKVKQKVLKEDGVYLDGEDCFFNNLDPFTKSVNLHFRWVN
ncbi:MAG: hypothetical protein HRT53_08280 [Colwellia sp.]|nr:hypothetical protein [Colwellia sp.]